MAHARLTYLPVAPRTHADVAQARRDDLLDEAVRVGAKQRGLEAQETADDRAVDVSEALGVGVLGGQEPVVGAVRRDHHVRVQRAAVDLEEPQPLEP